MLTNATVMNHYLISTLVLMALVTETVQRTEPHSSRNSVVVGGKRLPSSHRESEPQRDEKRYLRKKSTSYKKINSKSPKTSKSPRSKTSKKKASSPTRISKAPKRSKKKKGHKSKKVPKKCSFPDGVNVIAYYDGDRLISSNTIGDMYQDDKCDAILNTKECDYDGGDCKDFNKLYPDCSVPHPSYVGDRSCDGSVYNTTECGYDGGDCLGGGDDFGCSGAGNLYCENMFNTEKCAFDGGDCLDFNRNFPDCRVPDPSYVGDGICDQAPYYTLECGWDGGDCADFPVNCTVEDTYAIGDGNCQEEFNTTECEYDGGDCIRSLSVT